MFISNGLSYILKETVIKEINSRCELVSFPPFSKDALVLLISKDMCGCF